MQVKVNSGDLKNILGKLTNANTILSGQKGKGQKIKFKWVIRMLGAYTQGVTMAMGSVDAVGGYPRFVFDELSVNQRGESYWKNLAPATLKYKAAKQGYGKSRPYDELKWEFTIWKDTGGTLKGTYDTSNQTAQSISFAGISSVSPYFYRAQRVEEGLPSQTGKNLPPRPLFAAANHIFMHAMSKIINLKSDHPLANELRRELISDLFVKKVKWGGKRLRTIATLPSRALGRESELNTMTGTVGSKEY
jgi:hypothetical protein